MTYEKVADEAAIGDWWAICCEEDLAEIADEEDLEEFKAAFTDYEEEGTMRPMLWPSKAIALKDLTGR